MGVGDGFIPWSNVWTLLLCIANTEAQGANCSPEASTAQSACVALRRKAGRRVGEGLCAFQTVRMKRVAFAKASIPSCGTRDRRLLSRRRRHTLACLHMLAVICTFKGPGDRLPSFRAERPLSTIAFGF